MVLMTRFLAAVISCSFSAVVLAFDFYQNDLNPRPDMPFEMIDLQATENVAGDSIVIGSVPAPTFAVGDKVVLTVLGGATFADAAYTLEISLGGAGTGDLTYAVLQTGAPAGTTRIEFTMQESTGGGAPPLSTAQIFILSGNTFAGQSVNFNLPQIPGQDITLKFELFDSMSNLKGSAQHVLFESNLEPVAVVPTEDTPGDQTQTTTRALANTLGKHARNLTSQGLGLSGLLTGHGFGGDGISGFSGQLSTFAPALEQAIGGALPFTLKTQHSEGGSSGEFALSTTELNEWMGKFERSSVDRTDRAIPQPAAGSLQNPANLWVKGRWSTARDKRSGERVESDFAVIFLGGDFRVTADTRVGVIAQVDWFDEEAPGNGADAEGRGWMAGPYIVSRLDERLIFDARIAAGISDNKISPIGTYRDDYQTFRWQGETNLTGQFERGNWDIFPAVGISYFEEKQRAYTDSNGQRINSQEASIGSVNFGPTVYYNMPTREGTMFRPMLGVRGSWYFETSSLTDSNGNRFGGERFSAQARVGFQAMTSPGTTWTGSYTYDGLGVPNYRAHGVELSVRTPLRLDFLAGAGTAGFAYSFKNNESNTSGVPAEREPHTVRFEIDVPFN